MYVGGGYAVEARGFNYGIVKTKVKDRSWTDWAYLPESLLQYDTVGGVTIPEPEPVVVTPTVYKLGDRTLKRTSPNMTGNDVKECRPLSTLSAMTVARWTVSSARTRKRA